MATSRNTSSMLIWLILGASLYAGAMAVYFARSAGISPSVGQIAIPVSQAFGLIGMLGGFAFQVLRLQENRLRELEKREHIDA